MKAHLPLALRRILLAAFVLPVQAALIWSSGNWNTTDTSWMDNGSPAVFRDGDSVVFSHEALDTTVAISGEVNPASIQVSGTGYVFTGSGSIVGDGVLTLEQGASLDVENANSFTGGCVVESSALVTLHVFNALGSVNTGENAMGVVRGGGKVVIDLATAASPVSIQGESWAEFTGELNVVQGSLGLGRSPSHPGPGAAVELGAIRINVGAQASLITTLGGGVRGLVTNNIFANEVRTASGATIGNRDGHVNWTGEIYLNLQDETATTPVYDAAGSTAVSLYYAKDVVWDGVVSGAGNVNLSGGVPDTGADHRLILTNGGNTFVGTYRVGGDYLVTLALATERAAAGAAVQLESAHARLILMNTDAQITALNGSVGVVSAEGNGHYVLSLGGGNYAGSIKDSASAAVGITLGLTKTGSSTLVLSGPNVTSTGLITVQQGQIQFTGDASLPGIRVGSGAGIVVDGNLTLRSGAGLSIDVSAASSAPVVAGDALVLSDPAHKITVSGYENLSPGQYELLSWNTASGITSEQFVEGGLNDTAQYVYSLAVQGNSLQLVVGNMADEPWLWSGGSTTWADDSTAEWSNPTGSGPAGQVLMFSSRDAGTVTIDRVTPAGISVTGGQYTFVPEQVNSAGIDSAGNLAVSGDSTVLNIQMNNPTFRGKTILLGGTLIVGKANALGTSGIYFNGGKLQYGSGVSVDLSGQIQADSTSPVRVDVNGNAVNWSSAAGVTHSLASGLSVAGGGSLQLNWQAAGDAYSGDIAVQNSTLVINKTGTAGRLYGNITGNGTLQLMSPSDVLTIGGNNEAFSGTVLLPGDGQRNTGSVSFLTGSALGGSNTRVKVAGQRFWFASSTAVAPSFEFEDETNTYFDGSTWNSYTFTGRISGGGNMLVIPSCQITMSGDISGYSGRFEHPGRTNVSWLLGGPGVNGTGVVQAGLYSPGAQVTFTFQYAQPTLMSGVVSGMANLRQSGSGTLILTAGNTSSGNLTIDDGCEVRLGTASVSGSWGGATQLGSGSFTLVNGALATPLSTVEGELVADVAAGAVVDMGGTSAAHLQRIAVAAGGQLTGLSGDVLVGTGGYVESLSLTPAAVNVGSSPYPSQGRKVMMEIENGSLQIADSASVTLNLETVKSILQGKRQAVYIHLSNAALELQNGVTAASLFANSATTPAALGLTVLGVAGGSIVLEGAVRDVYMVMKNGDYATVTDYDRLQPYKATYVDSGYTLSLNLPGDNTQQAWVNNLLGTGDFDVRNTAQAQGLVQVMLNNEVLGVVDSDLSAGQDAQINTANTQFTGNISCGTAVRLVKTGSGKLTVGGALVADWLEIDEGVLQLDGTGNAVKSLHGDAGLVLNGQLEISGNALAFTGDLSGRGALELNGAMNGSGSVGSLAGSGSLRAAGAEFVVQNKADSTFSGSLISGNGQGVLTVMNGGGVFTLQSVKTHKSWSINNGGQMRLMQAGMAENTVLTLQRLSLAAGADTLVVLNTDKNRAIWDLGSLQIHDFSIITLESTGDLPLELRTDGTVVLGEVDAAELGADGKAPLNLVHGTVFRGIQSAWLTVRDGQLILHALRDDSNAYAALAGSANAETGAGLLWQIPNAELAQSPDLLALTHALDALVEQKNADAADALLSAAAGAGAAVLGMAVVLDMERQLKAIRNRTTSMGLDPQLDYPDLPLFNAWVNAEGDRRELRADGTAAGYTLSSWGATLGMDWDFTPTLTAGLALSGMYGDVQGKSTDMADGDVDTYYLSLFGRYAVKRWTHAWIGSVGRADISLKRHVSYSGGGYQTRGNTHATSLGLMYELGYVIPLDEVGDTCLQPLVNLSYRYAVVDSYTEHGSDAALHLGKQRMNVMTFGLGARAQTYGLENALNRRSLLEIRVLMKVDAGDCRSDCPVALHAMAARQGRVRSAEAGRVGLELGAGIAVPISEDAGHLFLDAAFEFRREETEVNGTVGYRMHF